MLLGAAVVLLLQVMPGLCEQLAAQETNPCKADFPEGSVDLSPLDSLNVTGKPRFSKFATVKIMGIAYELSYNPCSGFPCNSDQSAAVCAVDTFSMGWRFDVGSQAGGVLSLVNHTLLQIRYTSSDKVQGRDFLTLVTLACSTGDEDTLTLVQLSDANVLTFQLNSRHSCLVPHPVVAVGWSVGDYLVFFFFLALLLYFVAFLGINMLILKRSGVDVLPHRHAWAYLGLLVKDGCVFTVSAVRGRVGQRSGYDEI